MATVEQDTGRLFGSLWHRLNKEQYGQSVELFTKRFEANGFDLNWFRGKRCLDAGTGSGRYAVAMAMHGAAEVIGVDVSATGLETAREWAKDIPTVKFQQASVLELPFPDASFDFVCCAGVLHHTTSISRGLSEITRVLKPGGKLFLLLYGAGGLRWKLVVALRPLADELGIEAIDAAIEAAGLPANNRKHFMDDLFVPIQDFVKGTDLRRWMTDLGYGDYDSWTKGRFDHEASAEAQIEDMDKLQRIFAAVINLKKGDAGVCKSLGSLGAAVSADFIASARALIDRPESNPQLAEQIIIGEGNHRVLASRPE